MSSRMKRKVGEGMLFVLGVAVLAGFALTVVYFFFAKPELRWVIAGWAGAGVYVGVAFYLIASEEDK